MLLAMVAHYDMELLQLDVKTAFLYGDLDETIYMEQPDGYVERGKVDKVCLRDRSLYGLKPRQWHKRFEQYITSLGFVHCHDDACVYLKHVGTDVDVYLLLYADDMLIASRSMNVLLELKRNLFREFEMKDLGCARKIRRYGDYEKKRQEAPTFVSNRLY